MFCSSGGLCLYFTFTLTVLCNVLHGQRLEILPNQPEQTKAIGKAVMLTCRANVTDPNQVSPLEWRNNKGKVVERLMFGVQNQTMYTEIHPDGGLILFISKLDQSMAGEYTCTANLGGTEPLKTSVVLKTIFPITWIDAPLHQYPVINQDYKIRCHVQADPAASIDWLKNGETISTSDRYVIESTGLLIRNVQESDDGIYACRAAVIFTGDLDIRYIKVEVQIPPKIEPMVPVEIVEGEQAAIQCKATGKPPPRYSWIKGSNNQNLSRSGRFSVNENTGLLTINKIERDDHSEYRCVATNTAGDVETTVNVNVLFKPKIYEFANLTAPENKETKLICKASGRPLPQVLFRRFGSRDNFVIGPQPSNSEIILSQETHESKGETFGILSFIKLKRSDDGLYECIAKNKAGEMRKNGHITTEFAPNFESSKNQLPVWTWNKKPGNLSCIAESIPNATIEWRINDRQIVNDNIFRIIDKGAQSFLIVTHNDSPHLFAKYKCIATNKLGKAEHYVELKRATVPQPIQQAKVLSLTATTILFDIVGPAILDGLPVKAFIAQYREEKEIGWNNARNKTWSVESPYIIENLEPEMTYKFRFAAYNDVGLGGWDSPQTHTMSRRSAPNEPRILSSPEEGVVSSPYADHFDLRWKIPDNNGEPIDNYQIKFCAVRRVSGEWITTPDACNTEELSGGEQPEMRIGALVSDTHYKIELRAHNAIGYSTPAELIVKTARGLDTMVYKSDDPAISSATIIGIVVAAVLLILILVDLTCYCCNRAGILMAICERTRKMPPDEEDAKLGSYKAASAHPNTLAVPLPVKLVTTPVEEKEPLKQGDRNSVVNDTMKKSSSVEYDGTRVQARTGEIIGKNSAV